MVEDDDPLLLGLELDGLLEEPLALEGLELELDGVELEELPAPELEPLMPEDEEPDEPLSPACHSERDSLPSWSLSSLSNSLEELDEDAEPPEAELGLDEEDELGLDEDESLDEELGLDEPPVADEGEDDLLLCAMGEELELLELDFDASLA